MGPLIDILPNEQFLMKLSLNDSELKGKVWPSKKLEPDWQINMTDNKSNFGYSGYYTYYSDAAFSNIS
ncbi:hypothetical protein HYW19_02490 [Candidatus Woesearchaeota archaeon]|nr:hypothetical protein [Candidatus Woesearchaeota archaeon]